MRFDYRGEPVAVRGTLKRSQVGKCNIVLEEKAKPLTPRKFKRFTISVPAKMAKLTISIFDKNKIAKLRWLESRTSNLSAGGILLELIGYLEPESFLVLNMAIEDMPFPPLVLGQIIYCLKSDNLCYRTGVEFMTKEICRRIFEPAVFKKLPNAVLEYDENKKSNVINALMNYGDNS